MPAEHAQQFPVFVVGCPRSGTTLLYHMLVSSGAFANYRAETHLYDMLLPRFGSLRSRRNRRRFVERWMRSYYFERTGLDSQDLRSRLLSECRTGGDFLRIVLGTVAQRQGTPRWAECTPAHLLYMREIKRDVPDARFIHIVRDGRDVALSLQRLGWARPFPWDRRHERLVAGWTWEMMVRQGRRLGRELGRDYREVRFEDLVQEPELILKQIGQFTESDLRYARIRQAAIGSVSQPNTAFGEERGDGFSPVERWRRMFTDPELTSFEELLGPTLRAFGYELAHPDVGGAPARLRLRRRIFRSYRAVRRWLKSRTPLGRIFVHADLHPSG